MFDSQGEDETSQEHEVGAIEVVDAHLSLKQVRLG